LANALNQKLKGYKLGACFTQNKDELLLGFYSTTEDFYIKVSLEKHFTHLSFLSEFAKKKKNVLDFFSEALDKQVLAVKVYDWDRGITIFLEQEFEIHLMLFGHYGNVCLVQDAETVQYFRTQAKPWQQPQNLSNHESLDVPFEALELETIEDWKKSYPHFGKDFFDFLKELDFNNMGRQEKFVFSQNIWNACAWGNRISILENAGKIGLYLFNPLDYLPIEDSKVQDVSDPIEASNAFYQLYIQNIIFRQRKERIEKKLNEQLQKSEKYIGKQKARLDKIDSEVGYKVFADHLMANLGAKPDDQNNITVENFYQPGETLTIPVKKNKSIQETAEIFYRKAKNQKKEISEINRTIEQKESQQLEILSHLELLEKATDFHALRNLDIPKEYLSFSTKQDEAIRLPYKVFEKSGFQIRVGKSAKDNDEMLRSHSNKHDLWLHAKDVAGSHVIISVPKNTEPGQEVIDHAANLAAYYSKRRTDSNCPVILTPRKYVRKVKGGAPGQVTVDREEVVFADPNQIKI
jgi:predicted ribosome quality control (RQC) complex YloA/Tae2 family protein